MLLFFWVEICALLFLWGWNLKPVIFWGVDRKYPQMSIPVQIYAECPPPPGISLCWLGWIQSCWTWCVVTIGATCLIIHLTDTWYSFKVQIIFVSSYQAIACNFTLLDFFTRDENNKTTTIWQAWCIWLSHCELSLYVKQYSTCTSLVSMHLFSFAMPVVAQIIVTFHHIIGPWWQDFCHRVIKLINHLSNTFQKFYGRHTDPVGQYKKNVCQMFGDSVS